MSDPLTAEQEKVLMELEMILTTVKQIDSNLLKSIALLDSRESTQSKYAALVTTNTKRIQEILELLRASSD